MRIDRKSQAEFIPGPIGISLRAIEDAKVVMRAVVFGSDCRKMRELLPRADVIFLEEPDGSE